MNINVLQANIIKGVSVLLMLFHHLLAFPERVPEYSDLLLVSQGGLGSIAQFFKVCVPIFFFLFGYAMAKKNELLFTPYLFRIITFYKSYFFYFVIWTAVGFCFFYNTVYPGTLDLMFKFDVSNLFFWQLAYVIGIIFSQEGLLRFRLNSKALSYFYFVVINFLVFLIWLLFGKNILVFVAPLVVFSFTLLKYGTQSLLFNSLSFLGRLSLPVWLIHPFYCYYFYSNFVYSFSSALLAYVVLVFLSVITAFFLEKLRGILITYYSTKRVLTLL